MTDLTDLSDLPEPHGYHDHNGEQVPFYNINSCIQEAGKEPEQIAFGLYCVVCGFTPSLRVGQDVVGNGAWSGALRTAL